MQFDRDDLEEDIFPGNVAAYTEASSLLATTTVTPLVGAGASIPIYPSWTQALSSLVDEAQRIGAVSGPADLDFMRSQLHTDPLELASSLEEAFQPHQFRERLSGLFRSRDEVTQCHLALVRLRPKALITMNYDDGLELAQVRALAETPYPIRATDKSEITRWRQGRLATAGRVPILHWHGLPVDPAGMIFTSDDYHKFYSDTDNVSFLQYLWRDERLLVVGFGFSDPFLTRIGESVLRSIPSDNRHFAFIGVEKGRSISGLQRRQFSKKYRLSPIFYTVTIIDGAPDHSRLPRLLEALQPTAASTSETTKAESGSPPTMEDTRPLSNTGTSQGATRDFERGLLVFNDRQLYVEPRIYPAQADAASPEPALLTSTLALARSQSHIAIISRQEYGSTTLARRIVADVTNIGQSALYRDASMIPNYRKKIEIEFGNVESGIPALVIDNFDPVRHERMLKELAASGLFKRLIVITKAMGADIVESLSSGARGIMFDVFRLTHLDRSDIRNIATQMFMSADQDLISHAVEKTYNDLLDLCIPLTPGNIIMYLSVLAKENDFAPLNRVQIIERYVQELLRRPSDDYQDSFNARNRADVLSAFVYDLFDRGQTYCTDKDWYHFCDKYKSDSLVDFNEHSLLDDLLTSRILTRYGDQIIFRYRLFYSYFLGRHVANRHTLLEKILLLDRHLSVDGLIEVITAIGIDTTQLVEDILCKLDQSLQDLQKSYPLVELDPLVQFEWPRTADEESSLWTPIFERLAAGPAEAGKIDELKRSIQAERRTEDQKVVIFEFDKLESRIIVYANALMKALISSESLPGDMKVKCIDKLLEYYRLMYHVGLIYSPLIARHRTFYWNGITFENEIVYNEQDAADERRKTFIVALAMPKAIAEMAARDVGSKRLGEVYRLLATTRDWGGIRSHVLLTCLLRSKPKTWLAAAEAVIAKTGRNSFYLREALGASFTQHDTEVNTQADRDQIRRLIAMIKVKRDAKKDEPSRKLVSRALDRLEKAGAFKTNIDGKSGK